MKVLNNLKYSSTDEWVLVEGNIATIGITDYAQSQLSDIVYIEIRVSPGEKLALTVRIPLGSIYGRGLGILPSPPSGSSSG